MRERGFLLAEMTWPEVEAALETATIAVVPVGATEQHGPHGAMEIDAALAGELAKRLAARCHPHLLMTPPLVLGVSSNHMGFPGTITLRPETFIALVTDVVESLRRHGLRKILLLNGHGGNKAALGVVAQKVRDAWPDTAIALASPMGVASDVIGEADPTPGWGHACEIEISQCLYLAPWTVRREALAPGALRAAPGEGGHNIHLARLFHEVSDNGATGDATRASVELGEEIIETALGRLEEFVSRWARG